MNQELKTKLISINKALIEEAQGVIKSQFEGVAINLLLLLICNFYINGGEKSHLLAIN